MAPHHRVTFVMACASLLLPTPARSQAEDTVLAAARSVKRAYGEHPGLGDPTVHRIADGVYAITDLFHSRGPLAGVSAGIVFRENAVVFIDCGMSIVSSQFLWEIASARMTGNEDLYLILTHHHSDHVFGMRVFADRGVTVIAHEIAAAELSDDDGYYKAFITEQSGWTRERGDSILGDVVLMTPTQVIGKDSVLQLDGAALHLLVTPGHVPDELAVYDPTSKTLFAGDAIYESRTPATRFGGPAEWLTWIRQLERLQQLEIGTVVPGHGKPSSKDLIDRNISYLQTLVP
ncbi:MAG: MBL fold metallo-hydrolase [Gemmatimonadales bacterium]|nr:MBL fold metallo-hydrolase [Gemmatimonadales bacterium]